MNVFITGSESIGKSTLSRQLAEYFGVHWVPEFARQYIEDLNRDYTIDDLEIIGKKQIEQIESYKGQDLVFFDTGLIITSVWFQYKYGNIPEWLLSAIPVFGNGKYLLCEPDLVWVEDPVRENPKLRKELNDNYMEVIKNQGFDLGIVSGQGEIRRAKAIKIVEDWICLQEMK